MRNKISSYVTVFLAILFCLFLTMGCFGEDVNKAEGDILEEDNRTPIKVYIGSDINSHTVGGRIYHFSNLVMDYVEEHLPEYNIFFAFEFTWPGDEIRRGVFFDEWGDSDDPEPDIIIDYPHQIPFFLEENHLEFDMLEISEMFDIDLDRFDHRFLEQIMVMGDGTLYALPFVRSLHAIKYNKEAFNQYGITSPVGEITWQDALLWGESLPEQMISIDPKMLLNQLSTTYTEALEEENEKLWREIAPLYQHYYPNPSALHNRNMRSSRGDILHFFNTASGDRFLLDVDWDFAPYPIFPEHGRRGPDYVTDIIAVTPFTKNMEGAIEIMKLLTSDDFQKELTKIGHGSPLISSEVHQHFGTETPYYAGKNKSVFFRNNPSNTGYLTEEELFAQNIVAPHLMEISWGMDMEEGIEQMLADYVESLKER